MPSNKSEIDGFIRTSQKMAQHLTEQQISVLTDFQNKIAELSQKQNKLVLESISSLASVNSVHEIQSKTLDASQKYFVNLMDGVSQLYTTAMQNNIVTLEKSKANG